MCTTFSQYPSGLSVHLHEKLRFKTEDTFGVKLPNNGELNLYLSSAASFKVGSSSRICSFRKETATPILDTVENPMHLKNLSSKELKQLSEDVRSELSFIMSKTQKSMTASLAVVELTIATHHIFHSPMDKILWDSEVLGCGSCPLSHSLDSDTNEETCCFQMTENNGCSSTS